MGLSEYKLWNSSTNTFVKPASGIGSGGDNGFVVEANDISNVPITNFLTTGTIEKASDIIYPYAKKGVCSKLMIPKLTFFDPSGNSGKTARDIKRFFPMSKLNFYPTMCGKN
jgi:hypothetical protein